MNCKMKLTNIMYLPYRFMNLSIQELLDKNIDEVFEFKADCMLFPTLHTLVVYKKKFDTEKVKEIEDDLLDIWKNVVLDRVSSLL